MSTVIDARRRHFGVTAKQARDERLGTALGRLAFREMISETQYQAGVAFAQLYRDHHATVGLPVRVKLVVASSSRGLPIFVS